MTETPPNVAESLWQTAAAQPDALALGVDRTGDQCSFAELRDRVASLASSLRERGVGEGDSVVVMLRPGIDFVAAAFAVVALGASVVVVDPGLGLRRMMRAFAEVPARAVIAERLFHFVSAFFRPFDPASLRVSRGFWPGAVSLESLQGEATEFVPVPTAEPAILAFTSGATGRPKSVVMGHAALAAQIDAIRAMAQVGRGDVQLAFLPLAALMGPALECATIFGDVPLQRLEALRGERVVGAMKRWDVSHTIASPFVWQRVADHLAESTEKLPALRHLFVGGAPARRRLLERLRTPLPSATVHVGYGTTEVVPISSIQTPLPDGHGTPVGAPVDGLEVRIVERFGAQVRKLSECRMLGDGEIGEIIVSGPLVTQGYRDTDATAVARIEGDGQTWHRTGDVGYLEAGRLWLCGRSDEVVETTAGNLYADIVEPLFEASAAIDRAVLVGIGRPPQRPVIVVVPSGDRDGAIEAARDAAHTAVKRGELELEIDTFLARREVPLDPRHRAKVLRSEVARWATSRVARGALTGETTR